MVLRENILGFQGNQKSPYLKISVTDPKSLSEVRSLFESGSVNYKGYWKGIDSILTFDDVQYVMRFMIDCKVCKLSWLSSNTTSHEATRFPACPGLKCLRRSSI